MNFSYRAGFYHFERFFPTVNWYFWFCITIVDDSKTYSKTSYITIRFNIIVVLLFQIFFSNFFFLQLVIYPMKIVITIQVWIQNGKEGVSNLVSSIKMGYLIYCLLNCNILQLSFRKKNIQSNYKSLSWF